MSVITIHTAQNIDIDYEVGGLGERIVARIIDIVIFLPLFFIGIAFSGNKTISIIYYIGLAALFVFYDLICEVFFNGQSIGKRVMKIRVISLDGSRPRLSQFLLRWLFRLIDFTLTGGLGALIAAAVAPNVQRIGDLVAGTALIKTKPRTQSDDIVFNPVGDDYQPFFEQVTQLTDKDITLIHEVIDTFYKTGNNTIIYNMADKLRQHLGVSMPPDMNSLQFLQSVLKDYTHLTSQADTFK